MESGRGPVAEEAGQSGQPGRPQEIHLSGTSFQEIHLIKRGRRSQEDIRYGTEGRGMSMRRRGEGGHGRVSGLGEKRDGPG